MPHELKITTPGDREIVMTRTFDAPRELVFDAYTRPELLKRWMFGPDGWSLDECEIDLRVGGSLRFVWRHPAGHEMQMTGVYREIARPGRLVATERFEFGCAAQAGEQLSTATFAEADGRTTLVVTTLYPDRKSRDDMLASGMETGVAQSYDRLEDVVAELTARR